MAGLFHKAFDMMLGSCCCNIRLSLDCRVLDHLASYRARLATKGGLRWNSIGGHQLGGLHLKVKSRSQHKAADCKSKETYIVDVDGLSIHCDSNFITLALFGVGETVNIADACFAC